MKGSVLFVEDDAHIRHIYSLILSEAGYTVIPAGLVKTALMHLDVLDLVAVVLDLRLPNGHGWRVAEELVAKRNDVPIVIMSATPDEYPIQWPLVAALRKPVQRTPFLQAVAKAAYLAGEGVIKLRENVRRLRNLTSVQ